MVALTAAPAAYAVVGPIADAIGLDATLIAAAAITAVAHLATISVREVRELNATHDIVPT